MTTSTERETLLQTLKARFDKHPQRHQGINWADVVVRLEQQQQQQQAAWASLQAMEDSGGEPDVIGVEDSRVVFCDCAPESPAGRRSTCYDQAARQARKEHQPQHSALELAEAMGIALLTEAQYRRLQTLGSFDLKTSSWIATPPEVRAQGGALFCDRRYGQVFVYHNGVQSYYASRGFRGILRV